jgi:hypothetical protein
MILTTKPALLMELPDGKMPGFYAQIIKALANKVQLYDRDKELLIVNEAEELNAIMEIMTHYKINTERMDLVLLPAAASLSHSFTDYGFTSRAENQYLYKEQLSFFRFAPDSIHSERAQALDQLEEHLIVHFEVQEDTVYGIDKHLEELAKGITKAYNCEIQFVH